MADLDPETKRKIDEMHTAIVQQKTIIDNVVVTKDACEQKRKELYETINGCAAVQGEKIEKAGKVSKAMLLIATAVGSMVGLAIGLVVYLLTKGH